MRQVVAAAVGREQVPETAEQMLFERRLERQQGVEGAVPLLQLEGLHLEGSGRLGAGRQAGAKRRPSVAGEEVRSQSAKACSEAGARLAEHEHAVGEVAEALQAELMPQARDAEGLSPGWWPRRRTMQRGVGQEVLAAERDDGAAGGRVSRRTATYS